MISDAPLRVLASAILYRATLRALDHRPSAEEKMAIHARVEDTVWQMPPALVIQVEGRDVDEGIPGSVEWITILDALAEELNKAPR